MYFKLGQLLIDIVSKPDKFNVVNVSSLLIDIDWLLCLLFACIVKLVKCVLDIDALSDHIGFIVTLVYVASCILTLSILSQFNILRSPAFAFDTSILFTGSLFIVRFKPVPLMFTYDKFCQLSISSI